MDNTTKNDTLSNISKSIFEWVELFAISIAVVIIVLNCFARYSPVDGASMNQTLQDKDVLILSNLFYTPEQGDIVVFASSNADGPFTGTGYNKPYVKRVIATEGQTVDINFETWEIFVDGEKIEEDYAYYDEAARPSLLSTFDGYISYPHTVEEGHVFVLGDNRWNSQDSRIIGDVDVRDILGRVVFRVYPNTGTVE